MQSPLNDPGTPPPPIGPLADATARPQFSVMVPTYRPGAHLVEALRSVLADDPGAAALEIAVVDDASPDGDLDGLIAQAAPPGRVRVYRHATNAGLAGNWNRCIGYARGELVHILHQDDRVRSGFYAAMAAARHAAPQALMAFCRCEFLDAQGERIGATHRRALRAGPMRDWLAKISEATRLQCPGAVVPRSTYERLGGYRPDLRFAIDWEMWVRIAAAGEVWYEPRVLASYRKHAGNATTRLEASDVTDADMLQAISIFSAHLPAARRAQLLGRTYREFVRLRLRHSARDAHRSSTARLAAQVDLARRLMREHPAAASWRNRWRLWRLEQRLPAAGPGDPAGAPR